MFKDLYTALEELNDTDINATESISDLGHSFLKKLNAKIIENIASINKILGRRAKRKASVKKRIIATEGFKDHLDMTEDEYLNISTKHLTDAGWNSYQNSKALIQLATQILEKTVPIVTRLPIGTPAAVIEKARIPVDNLCNTIMDPTDYNNHIREKYVTFNGDTIRSSGWTIAKIDEYIKMYENSRIDDNIKKLKTALERANRDLPKFKFLDLFKNKEEKDKIKETKKNIRAYMDLCDHVIRLVGWFDRTYLIDPNIFYILREAKDYE